jgi:phosphate acyltransferase
MGGDHGIAVTVPAALKALSRHESLVLHLIGDEPQISKELARSMGQGLSTRIKIKHTADTVTATDNPAVALRGKNNSSMYLAVEMVKQGEVEACVSAGNTGALLLTGRHLLKTLPGIDKPAIVARIPGAVSKTSLLLDVGANVDCKAEQLFQFAVMGSVLAEALNRSPRARVGLLNIGEEDFKGNEQVRKAAQMLEACEAINFIGYVEGNDLFEGVADVVVCDGFVGNVTIKSSAGVVNVINTILRQGKRRSWVSRLSSLLMRPLIRQLQKRIDPARFNGASLLGLQGSIIKSHGNATVDGFVSAIEQAIREADKRVPQLIADRVSTIMAANADTVAKQ